VLNGFLKSTPLPPAFDCYCLCDIAAMNSSARRCTSPSLSGSFTVASARRVPTIAAVTVSPLVGCREYFEDRIARVVPEMLNLNWH
jgi:hypothetical protein